jgi:biopolymer transport protein ExbB
MLSNILFFYIEAGGVIMYPIIIVMFFTFTIVIERSLWWLRLGIISQLNKRNDFLSKVSTKSIDEVVKDFSDEKDPVIQMMVYGLNHRDVSLEGALELGAGNVIQTAGRYIGAMDTVVTLAPLLGLLGTVTGIMGSFRSLGNSELAVEKVTGGIGEALIATAFGLGIAIFTLIPMNYFHGRLAKLKFDLESHANSLLLLMKKKES